MNQPRLIFKNTVALGAARLFERVANAFLSFLIARYLGAPALGVYSAALVFLTLISLVAEMGSVTFLTREIARDRARTGDYVVHFGAITALLSGSTMLLGLLVVPHLSYSTKLSHSVYIIIFATLPVVLKIVQEAIFVAHQRAEFITWSTLIGAVINVVSGLFLLRWGKGIGSIVLVYTIVQYVMALFYFLALNHYICRLRWHFSLSFAWTLVQQVRAFTGSSLLGGLLARPEVMILSLFGNDAQIGFYSASLRVVDLWGIIPETYMRNVFPVLSQTYVTDRHRCQLILEKSIKYLLAISLPLMCGVFVAARPLIYLLYGRGFAPSIPVLRIMVFCIPLSFLFELFWRLLAARDQQYLMLRAQLIMVFLRLAGGYLLISRLQSFGAALSAALFLMGHIILLGFYASRDGTRLQIFRLGWRFSVAAVGMGLIITMLIDQSGFWLAGLAAGLIYMVMILMLKAFSPEDVALFRKIRQVRTIA